jgi:DNA-3-methyladenine glycosylase
MKLGRDFFDRPAPEVARALLGCVLVFEGKRGRIVETEAYLFEGDAASHQARGETPATRALRMGPGTVYIHPMRAYVGMDIVARGGSVLLRALDIPHAEGPGKLCRAMGITRALYGLNVADGPIRVEAGTPVADAEVITGARVGLSKAVELELRFRVRKPRARG